MTEEIPAWRDVNTVRLRGRIGRDPEVREMHAGRLVNLSIATSEKWRDKRTGDLVERTEWHRVVVFNEELISVAEGLRKGERVELVGQLQTRKWSDQAGLERQSAEIVLRRFGSSLVVVLAEDRAAPRGLSASDGAAQAADPLGDVVPF